MPASIKFNAVIPGVHRIRKMHADGTISEYWYAWRGGPRILKATARTEAALQRDVARLTPGAVLKHAEAKTPNPKSDKLHGLITRYLRSPQFEQLSERTKRDRRKSLDRVRGDLGDLPILALQAKLARAMLIKWRDKFAQTPKTADELLGSLAVVLQWAYDRGEISQNPLQNMPRLYRSNRADIIWTEEDLAKLKPHCSPELWQAVHLAALTGIRVGDLIKLTWSAVGEDAISFQTSKSNYRVTAVVPILPPTRELLRQIKRCDSTTVLNSSKGRPWTESGLNTAFQRAKKDAGIKELRFHDLRGTAATNFVEAGLLDADVATIVGWSTSRIDQIKKRYVSANAMGRAMIDRMKQASAVG